jgi:hypothetical protein
MVELTEEMIASFPAEEEEAIRRAFIAAARAEDAAARAERLGDRDLFISGFGVIGAQELAEAMWKRARRLRDALEEMVAKRIKANEVATHAAADAVAAVENQGETPADGDDGNDDDGSRQQPPRQGRPPKPSEV